MSSIPGEGVRVAAALTALALVLLATATVRSGVAADRGLDPRLRDVHDWAFAIGNHTLDGDVPARYRGFDLVVADGQEARPGQIAGMQRQGTVVLAYLSVGTIESYRPWYRELKRYRLEAWKDWKDEWYADVSRRGFRRAILREIAPRILAKGFDGLFLDNTDMIETHQAQTSGMRRLIRRLATRVHADDGLLFAQNGGGVITPSLPFLDGWNREDVSWTYDFDHRRYRALRAGETAYAQRELRRIAGEGLLVTATDYTAHARGGPVRTSIANACDAGALPYVSDIGLRRVPESPYRCR